MPNIFLGRLISISFAKIIKIQLTATGGALRHIVNTITIRIGTTDRYHLWVAWSAYLNITCTHGCILYAIAGGPSTFGQELILVTSLMK